MNYKPEKIYAILDYQFLRKNDFRDLAESYLISGINLIEIKILNTTDNIRFEILNEVLKLKSKYDFALIFYGRIDIVKKLNLDGIHLDNSDKLSIAEARSSLHKNAIITLGCYSYQDAVDAQKNGADYIVIGPFYPSSSEKHMGHYNYLSISTLEKVVRDVTIPIVAFGGIDLSNINNIIKTKVDAVAIVSNVFKDAIPFEKVKTFISLFDKNYKKSDVIIVNYSDEILKYLIVFLESHFSDYLNFQIVKEYKKSDKLLIFCVSEENINKINKDMIKNSIIFTDIDTHLFREQMDILGSIALLSIKEKIQLDIFESIIWDIINI